MELTLSQIEWVLQHPIMKEREQKYQVVLNKLREVKAYLLGKTKIEPKDPFMPLSQLPRELFE